MSLLEEETVLALSEEGIDSSNIILQEVQTIEPSKLNEKSVKKEAMSENESEEEEYQVEKIVKHRRGRQVGF